MSDQPSPSEKKPPDSSPQTAESDFSSQADEAAPGLVAEFRDFLIHNKAWWLTPIIIVLLLAAILAIWGGSAAAPFIYPGI